MRHGLSSQFGTRVVCASAWPACNRPWTAACEHKRGRADLLVRNGGRLGDGRRRLGLALHLRRGNNSRRGGVMNLSGDRGRGGDGSGGRGRCGGDRDAARADLVRGALLHDGQHARRQRVAAIGLAGL